MSLGSHMYGGAHSAIYSAIVDTVGYISSFNCEWLIASGLDMSTLLGASLLGAVALYVPYTLVIHLLLSCNLLSVCAARLLGLAYRLSCAVVGAAILNMFFGMAIPLAPVFACAVIGTAIAYLLQACGCCCTSQAENEPMPINESSQLNHDSDYDNFHSNIRI